MTYSIYEIVKVPFPFSEIKATKIRPALIISSTDFSKTSGQSIVLMITSFQPNKTLWASDHVLEDFKEAGLPVPSVARFKIFTLDHRLVLGKVGYLSQSDQKNIRKNLKSLLSLS